jgi:hypothetical protein
MLVEDNRITGFSCRQVRNVDRKEKMVSVSVTHSVPDGTGGAMTTCIFYQHIVPTAQRLHFLPPGVASIAAGFRAESPAINSTGQRPVGIRAFQQPALKGRNPVIGFDAALSGLRKQAAFFHRADYRAFSPEPSGYGPKTAPSKWNRINILWK